MKFLWNSQKLSHSLDLLSNLCLLLTNLRKTEEKLAGKKAGNNDDGTETKWVKSCAWIGVKNNNWRFRCEGLGWYKLIWTGSWRGNKGIDCISSNVFIFFVRWFGRRMTIRRSVVVVVSTITAFFVIWTLVVDFFGIFSRPTSTD